MKIAYIGKVSLASLAARFDFDRPLPEARWSFPLGSDIVAGLVRRGHEIHVVTDHCVDQVETYSAKGLFVHLVPCRRRTRWTFLTLFSKEVRGMREVVREIAPDVVFAQWLYANAYAGLTSGYPTLAVSHDSPWRIVWVNRGLAPLILAFYAQLFVLPRLRHVSAVSPYIVDELRRFNRYRRPIAVIPNGLDVSTGIARAPVRREATTVAVVADWSALKNVKTFFRAWSALKKRRPRFRAVVFGSGLDEAGAGRWMAANGIPRDGLELRGLQPRDVVARFLREEADVFCSPTLEESFGMVFIEAMAAGVPCVGGERSGAVPWVMGEGGVTCDVTKPEALADCLESLLDDYEGRQRLSAAGVKRVREMFDIEKVVDGYERELRKVADESS